MIVRSNNALQSKAAHFGALVCYLLRLFTPTNNPGTRVMVDVRSQNCAPVLRGLAAAALVGQPAAAGRCVSFAAEPW
jgi:hypothetical protein